MLRMSSTTLKINVFTVEYIVIIVDFADFARSHGHLWASMDIIRGLYSKYVVVIMSTTIVYG